MTSSHPTPSSRPGVHPDDEALNAVLDGEGTADDEAHIGSCRRCAARLDRFAAVSRAVAAPVGAVSPDRRERAVAAALAAFGDERPTGAEADDPVDLARTRARRRQRSSGRWLGVAAALLLVVGAVGVAGNLISGSGDDSGTEVATDRAESGDTAEGSLPDVAGGGGDLPVDGGDLGPVADGTALRRAVVSSLDPADLDAIEDWASQAGSAADEAESETSELSRRDSSDPGPESGEEQLREATRADPDRCTEAAAEAAGQPGPPRYRADATVDDRPVVVYGFAPTDAPDGRTDLELVAVAVEDDACRVQLREGVQIGG